jgi:protease I
MAAAAAGRGSAEPVEAVEQHAHTPAGRKWPRSIVSYMVLAQRKVLLLAADDFEDMELLYPLYRLAEEGVAVTVAGLDDHPLRGKKGYGPLAVDTTVDEVTERDFDALVIPGGYAPDKLRRSEAVLNLVQAFDGERKPIAFICHAGWVPISAKIIKGRRATSVGAIRDDMVNAGADWVDEATVVDGHLISARTPADLGPWMKALLTALSG